MQPCRTFFAKFSERNRHVPVALTTWKALGNLKTELAALEFGEKCVQVYDQHMERLRKDRHNLQIWEYLPWFVPLNVGTAHMHNKPIPDSARMMEVLKLPDFPTAEWDKYVATMTPDNQPVILKDALGNPDIDRFWRQQDHEYPQLHRFALSLIWLPPVVFESDSVMSTMEQHVSKRQASMKPETIANRIFVDRNTLWLSDERYADESSDDDD